MRYAFIALLLCLRAFAPLPAGTSDEETALLRAIVAHPDEDTPRLAYADWLQEHGRDEQAEFIRLQIGIASGAIEESSKLERARTLVKVQLEQLPSILRTKGITVRFIRGFPEDVAVHRDIFVSPGYTRRILEAAPFLRKLGVIARSVSSHAIRSSLPPVLAYRECWILRSST